MKKILGALVGLFMVGCVHANNVAVVDFRAALLQSNMGQKESAEPRKQVAAMDARLKSEREKVQKKADALKRDELTLSPADLKKRRMELMQSENQLRSMAAGMQRQAQGLEQSVINKLTPKGEAALKAIIKKRKLDLVLNRDVAVYAAPDSDITKALIDRLNKGK
ncbi:periplasmic chaperone [Marinomonas spartinae]|uniref:Periplasmic chaperone n=1 Tax=Marinomonas spartinae TaxID=1792290 RepID=A0A1A8T9H9_9GAMM|nr:OmpH family outer membrane protein [Marinomonas spartinae]SBS27693.1 periplasmic chaperone [Marinomonas spartinae]SBS28648.1 periplasmic chaperone [Marinomonas spartinae]